MSNLQELAQKNIRDRLSREESQGWNLEASSEAASAAGGYTSWQGTENGV